MTIHFRGAENSSGGGEVPRAACLFRRGKDDILLAAAERRPSFSLSSYCQSSFLNRLDILTVHQLFPQVTAALLAPGEAMVDPWLLAMSHFWGAEVNLHR